MKIIFLFIFFIPKLINSHYFVIYPTKNVNYGNFSDIETLFSSLNSFVEKVVFTDNVTIETNFDITTSWNLR